MFFLKLRMLLPMCLCVVIPLHVCHRMLCMLWNIDLRAHHTEIIELLACLPLLSGKSMEGRDHVLFGVAPPEPIRLLSV